MQEQCYFYVPDDHLHLSFNKILQNLHTAEYTHFKNNYFATNIHFFYHKVIEIRLRCKDHFISRQRLDKYNKENV